MANPTGIYHLGDCQEVGPLANCVVVNEGHTVVPKHAYIIMSYFVRKHRFLAPNSLLSSLDPGHSSKEIFAAT